MSFYNTIPQTDAEKKENYRMAVSQESHIFLYMCCCGDGCTAWGIKQYFPYWEITSIRRALWNLENRGQIQQIGWANGPKGKKVGVYKAITKAHE
jgi:hypothetical protein